MHNIAQMSSWFTFPQIDPVALALGPLEIRWYALSYIAGILLAINYAKWLCRHEPLWRSQPAYKSEQIDDFLLWSTLGIILGGRLGYVIFYDPAYFLENPSEIPAMWTGGMSFHGGMLGVFVAIILFARIKKASLLSLMDLASAAAPIGLFFGRLANFVNGELFGRVTSHPIGIVFPNGGPLPRHPSQLYEAAMEGLLLFGLLAAFVLMSKSLKYPGRTAGVFGIGYGVARIVSEIFREPDQHIGFLAFGMTMGMILSLPMILFGCFLIFKSLRRT